MCDLSRVSGFLIAAKCAYLVTLGLLVVGIANAGSLFLAGANGLIMGLAIASTGLAMVAYIGALAEVDRCRGICETELAELRNVLFGLVATMGVSAAALASLLFVSVIPFVGSVGIAIFLTWFIGFTVLATAGVELLCAQAVNSFNACRASASTTTIATVVIVFAYIVFVAALAFVIGGGVTGAFPLRIEF